MNIVFINSFFHHKLIFITTVFFITILFLHNKCFHPLFILYNFCSSKLLVFNYHIFHKKSCFIQQKKNHHHNLFFLTKSFSSQFVCCYFVFIKTISLLSLLSLLWLISLYSIKYYSCTLVKVTFFIKVLDQPTEIQATILLELLRATTNEEKKNILQEVP